MKSVFLIAAVTIGVTPAVAQTAPASAPISASRAVAAAEKATGAKAMDVDLDQRRGRLVYEIDLADGGKLIEVEIAAQTGEVLSQRMPRFENLWGEGVEPVETRALAQARPLSETLAALEQETGGRALDVDFDVEAGQARYEVELSTKAGVAEVYLDPMTGERLVAAYDD